MSLIEVQLFEEAIEDLKSLIKFEKKKVKPNHSTLWEYNNELKKAKEILRCMK